MNVMNVLKRFQKSDLPITVEKQRKYGKRFGIVLAECGIEGRTDETEREDRMKIKGFRTIAKNC